MAEVIVAYDEQDISLGVYFEKCSNHIIDSLKTGSHSYLLWPRQKLNSVYVKAIENQLQPKSFIFLAYSHGTEQSLTATDNYVCDENLHIFQNTFFYTFSCLSGVKLGPALIEKGCKTFIGYKKDAFVVIGYLDEFEACTNEGIYTFLVGQTSGESYNNIITKYSDTIDAHYKTNYFLASVLRSNRDSLVIYGDENLTISHI